MAPKKSAEKAIILTDVAATTKTTKIHIVGDSDLVLNQMNARTVRELSATQTNQPKDKRPANKWEDVTTAIHWRDNLENFGIKDTYEDCTEEMLYRLLAENAPCITAFGLKKSWMAAVVRNGLDTYSTKFDACLNITATKGLIPVTFTAWSLDERLMSPKRGAPVLTRLNHFSGWEADVTFNYIESIYSLEQILDIINLAGFGLGIGSGRTSGYGRYHISGNAK
ncbi:MAG: hypothetical protein LUF68_04255 [Clostridiales bacterium]|nr:hypothetical protein [Clostridiales bacterium]